MIDIRICEKCRGRGYALLMHEYPVVFYCPAVEDLIKENTQPPPGCPRKMEHAVSEGMKNAK